MALLIIAGTLTYALFGRSTIVVFFVASSLSALAQMLLGGWIFDNFGGMSGGVYALFGMVMSAGATNRTLLPKGGWLLITNLTVLGILSVQLLSASAATVAHLCGLVLGAVAGLYHIAKYKDSTE